jgi:inner membrane protein
MEAQQQTFLQRNSIMIKAVIVGFLILALLIPAALIQDLVRERQQRQEEVIAEVSSKWAYGQKITGPFLLVPYTVTEKNDKGQTYNVKYNAYFLPEELNINGQLFPEVRKRSIYSVVLYKTDLKINGKFAPLNFSKLGIDPATINWNEIKFCMGLSDNRGIAEQLQLNFNNTAVDMNPDLPANSITKNGVNALTPLTEVSSAVDVPFTLNLKLNGSERLYFTPVGKQTKVNLVSDFKNASFIGNYLPVEPPNSEKGFNAKWNVLHFTRSIPQSWTNDTVDIDTSAFGVELLQGVDSYAKTMRSVKYALLFIALTLCLFFFIEILQKRKVHPLQYVLVGFALCIFYTLLLSISEYKGFGMAYIIAAASTVLLITFYIKSVFKKWTVASVFFFFLSALYAMIYILIQLQDGSLLFGSIGLFVLLAVVMYYSGKIDWYGTKNEIENSDKTTSPIN